MEFTIDRSRWRFGGTAGSDAPVLEKALGATYLENEQGYSCCLGFACRAAGAPAPAGLYDSPAALVWQKPGHRLALCEAGLVYEPPYYGASFATDSPFSAEAVVLNDNAAVATPEELEAELKALCERYGHVVTFVGAYSEAQRALLARNHACAVKAAQPALAPEENEP